MSQNNHWPSLVRQLTRSWSFPAVDSVVKVANEKERVKQVSVGALKVLHVEVAEPVRAHVEAGAVVRIREYSDVLALEIPGTSTDGKHQQDEETQSGHP